MGRTGTRKDYGPANSQKRQLGKAISPEFGGAGGGQTNKKTPQG